MTTIHVGHLFNNLQNCNITLKLKIQLMLYTIEKRLDNLCIYFPNLFYLLTKEVKYDTWDDKYCFMEVET